MAAAVGLGKLDDRTRSIDTELDPILTGLLEAAALGSHQRLERKRGGVIVPPRPLRDNSHPAPIGGPSMSALHISPNASLTDFMRVMRATQSPSEAMVLALEFLASLPGCGGAM